jgi:hypothetical protein
MFERPDVHIPGIKTKSLVSSASDVRWRGHYLFFAPFSTPTVILYGNETSVRFNL